MEKEIILRASGLRKTFGETKAVKSIDIEIYKGEIRGLIGENGSGKSTMVSMLAGVLTKDAGAITFLGKPYEPADQLDANRKGCSIIMQEMNTIEGLTVSENLFLGNEGEFFTGGFKNSSLMNTKAKTLLQEYGLVKINPANDIGYYSFEARKMIELVKAVYFTPKLFIVDETTTALSQNGRNKLYDIMKELKTKGNSVLFISHDLGEILELCDTITVFRDGELINTVDAKEVGESDLKRFMVGRDLNDQYYREDYGRPQLREVLLEVKNISIPNQINNVSFNLHKGEILGIGGLTDCGMHELGKVIYGALKNYQGKITLTSKGIQIKTIKQAIENGIAYVSKNRDEEALMLNASILDNICLVSLDDLKKVFHISKIKERQFAEEYSERLQVKMSSVRQFVSALSGGNKQKVSLAKWIAKDSNIFVLDCPTRGIDVTVKAAVYSLMYELINAGKSIIMISEEILELIGMCDRIIILKHGAVSGEIERKESLNEEEIIHYMI
jgi:ribose transport system ATP-binding protein